MIFALGFASGVAAMVVAGIVFLRLVTLQAEKDYGF